MYAVRGAGRLCTLVEGDLDLATLGLRWETAGRVVLDAAVVYRYEGGLGGRFRYRDLEHAWRADGADRAAPDWIDRLEDELGGD